MSDIAIRVENLGKLYRIGKRERYRTLRDSITDTFAAPFRRMRGSVSENGNGTPDFIWALKDLSFEVKRGEVIGVIGRNGAGKSTLLKVLSRITEPTEGHAEIHGRIASLLEVGTGFHPELTGRENIYLNGAILGMKRVEINRKFDEMVAFGEVEKFLDTPVKHYSSGMYVRLAFAVAAHLEPEILIVDEVLAVGDAAFQKKCLGKMGEVSKGGRTVFFVSHNMAAVNSLTTHALVLNTGRLMFNGATDSAIHTYLQRDSAGNEGTVQKPWGRGTHTAIRGVRLVDSSGEPTTQYFPGQPIRLELEIETDGIRGMSLEVFLVDAFGSKLGMALTYQFHGQMLPSEKGVYVCRLELKPLWLSAGGYTLEVRTSLININWDHCVETAVQFEVPFSSQLGHQYDFKQSSGHGALALLAAGPIRFEPILVHMMQA